MKIETPQADIDRCLAIEASVTPDEMPLYMECMNNVPLSVRVRSPRPCDCEGRDVRSGCILTSLFLQAARRTKCSMDL